MSTHTAEEFKHARFATHPDGRIAARMDPYIKHGWASMRASSPLLDWLSDEGMARDGWSPLDETRLPRVVTDEEVLAALNAQGVAVAPKMHPAPSLDYWGDKPVEAMRAALTAAREAQR
jgi:hypothetical protein